MAHVQRLPVLQPLHLVDGPAGVEAAKCGGLVQVHLEQKERYEVIHHCDQIWRNFSTLQNLYKYSAIS